MSPPRISVVIPTFNRAAVIRRSLDSVLAQTLQPLEVILVDDCSTDETERVVRELGSGLVRYVRLDERLGAQAARNRGIREARGDWIAFQDSDDEWLPDKLERQVALLARRGFDPCTVVHGSAVVPGRSDPMPERRIPEDALDALLQAPAPFLQAMLVSRAALERIGGLDEQVPSFHEWETSIRLAGFCEFVEPADPVFVYHAGRLDSISASGVAYVRGYEYVIDKFRSEIVERCGAETWEWHVRFLVRSALNFGLWDEARRLLARSRERDARHYAYALCARLRLGPSYVARARRRLSDAAR